MRASQSSGNVQGDRPPDNPFQGTFRSRCYAPATGLQVQCEWVALESRIEDELGTCVRITEEDDFGDSSVGHTQTSRDHTQCVKPPHAEQEHGCKIGAGDSRFAAQHSQLLI